MKKNMCFKLFSLLVIGIFSIFPIDIIAQTDSASKDVEGDTLSVISTKEEKNRNVMLSAESATMPRQLNIGLPFNGDILIMENDVPVVYQFWTQMPTTAWRYDQSIGRVGLMSFQEGALTFGKVGYVVTSWDRQASRKFKGYASIYTTNFGTLRYDANISGPIGKKGWGYTASIYENYDRGSGANLQYSSLQERAEFFKFGLNKRYKNGEVSFLYKHAEVKPYVMGGYSPLVYLGNGETKEVEGFKLGRDSYILGNGLFPYFDYNTGEAKMGDITSNEASQNLTDAFYLSGKHRFKSKIDLKYTAMYMKSKASLLIQYPLSIGISEPEDRPSTELYTIYGTENAQVNSMGMYDYAGTEYNGSVQMVNSQYYPQVDINTFIARIELSKKFNSHNARLGLTYQYYSAPIITNSGIYYQSVEPNPKLLNRYSIVDMSANGLGVNYYKVSDSNGAFPMTGSYSDNTYSKTALYFSDDFAVGKRFNFGIGARIEHQNDEQTISPYLNEFVNDRLHTEKFKHKWNKVFISNAVMKLTNNFGFLVDATYNSWYNRYWDFGTDGIGNIAKENDLIVTNFGGGIYWNHGKLFSMVSKITRIRKENNITGVSITNPNDASETEVIPLIYYDIETLGWSTDIISQPFKNLNFHLLFTLQEPNYKNYSYSSHFNNEVQNYSYNNNLIPDLSKVITEFDASLWLFNRDVRVWGSLRYFGEQQANKINTIFYNGWWENFGGIDYRLNRKVTLKAQVVNFLNESGVKGALVGGDQISNASDFVGRKIVASGIRPRTFELTATFKF